MGANTLGLYKHSQTHKYTRSIQSNTLGLYKHSQTHAKHTNTLDLYKHSNTLDLDKHSQRVQYSLINPVTSVLLGSIRKRRDQHR
jgi:hypothetical protein